MVYSKQYNKYILVYRDASGTVAQKYRVGVLNANGSMTWDTARTLFSEDSGDCKMWRGQGFDGTENFLWLSNGGQNSGAYARWAVCTFNGTQFTVVQAIANINTNSSGTGIRNYNGYQKSLISCFDMFDPDSNAAKIIRDNSTNSSRAASGTCGFGMGGWPGQWYESQYLVSFAIYPTGDANNPHNYSRTTFNWTNANSGQVISQHLEMRSSGDMICHPNKPYFYFVRKYWHDSTKLYLWKWHYNDEGFSMPQTSNGATWGTFSGYGRRSIVTTNSSGSSVDLGSMGGREETPVKLAIQENGVGRLFISEDSKLYSVSFDPQDDLDYKDTDNVDMISGTFNVFAVLASGSTETRKNDVWAYFDPGSQKWFVMWTWFNDNASSNTDKGRIYYDIFDKTHGYSSASSENLSYNFSGMYMGNHQREPLDVTWIPSRNEAVWTRSSEPINSKKEMYGGVWGATANNIADKFIGVASTSASANASVDIDMPYVETSNQSGLTIGETVQFLRSSGAISSTADAVNTSTHKEIGIATSASTFIIRDR